MLLQHVIEVLESKYKEAKGAGSTVELDVKVLKSALDGLHESAGLSQEIEKLNDQMRVKPSVARKLAERISFLENELKVTRDATTVQDLERKVQKLELDLKQSYSTSRFTLKNGLLNLEKKYRAHIYGHPDVQELWHEVTWLLVEEKDKDKAIADGLHPPGSLTKRPSTKKSSQGSPGAVDAQNSLSPGAVQHAVDHLHEIHGRAGPVSHHFPGGGTTPKHQRSGSNAAMYSNWSNMAADEAAIKAPVDVAESLAALRGMFLNASNPIFPQDSVNSNLGSAGSGGLSPGNMSAELAALAASGASMTAAQRAELEALGLSVEKLLELWKQRLAAQGDGSEEVQHQRGAVWSGTGPAPSPGTSHRRTPSGNVVPIDASYLEAQAEAALLSLAQLRERFAGEGGLLGPRGGGQKGAHGPGGPGADAVSYFDKQADALLASIQHLRSLWNNPNPPTGAHGPRGLPPLPGGRHALSHADRQAEHLRSFLLGPSYGGTSSSPQLSSRDLLSHFIAFLQSKGMYSGTTPSGAHQRSRFGNESSVAGANSEQAGEAAAPVSSPGGSDVIQQFNAYLRELGFAGGITANMLSAGSGGGDDATGSGGGATWGTRLAAGTSPDALSWLPLLPALRLSTAAAQGGTPGCSARELLAAAALSDAAPSWWAPALQAAAKKGDEAVNVASSPRATAAGALNVASSPRATAAGVRPAGASGLAAAAAAAGSEPTTPTAQQQPTAAAGAAQPAASLVLPGAASPSTPVTAGAAGAGASAGGATGGVTSPQPAAVFNPLLLPGPARTMQAVMAHVRQQHAEFLARCPEAEVLLAEALAASAELQNAQDRSLLRMAINKKGSRAPTNANTPSRLSPSASGNVDISHAQPSFSLKGSGLDLASYGSVAPFEFAAVPGGGDPASAGKMGPGGKPGEIQVEEPAVTGVPEGVNMEDVAPAPLTMEDYAAEIAEVRAIAARHAEHAAALQELLARIATQHAEAAEHADDLELRVALGEREAALLREEVDRLTRLLVDVKMAFAERDDEAQRLSGRLKRALQAENMRRDEVEELKRQLAVMGEDVVLMDADYANMMQAAMAGDTSSSSFAALRAASMKRAMSIRASIRRREYSPEREAMAIPGLAAIPEPLSIPLSNADSGASSVLEQAGASVTMGAPNARAAEQGLPAAPGSDDVEEQAREILRSRHAATGSEDIGAGQARKA